LSKILNSIEEWILVSCIVLLAITSICNVIGRTFLDYSLESAEELSVIFIISITFLGIGYCARHSRHISMSAIVDSLPEKYRFSLLAGINLITSGLFFLLTYYAYEYIVVVKDLGSIFPVLNFPVYYLYYVMPIGFLVAAIQYLQLTFFRIKLISKKAGY